MLQITANLYNDLSRLGFIPFITIVGLGAAAKFMLAMVVPTKELSNGRLTAVDIWNIEDRVHVLSWGPFY